MSVIDETRALPIFSLLGRVMLEWGEERLVGLRLRDDQWKNIDDHDVNASCRGDEMSNSRGTWRVI